MKTQIGLQATEKNVKAFLADQLGPSAGNIETVRAVEDISDDGDEIVIINVTIAASERPLDPDQLTDIPFLVSQHLEAAGEQRFCHVRIHFAEKQALRGW